MDDEVTQIFKKWKLNNPVLPKRDGDAITTSVGKNETFDSRTFTRPPRRRTFVCDQPSVSTKSPLIESEMQSMESGVEH